MNESKSERAQERDFIGQFYVGDGRSKCISEPARNPLSDREHPETRAQNVGAINGKGLPKY